MITYESEKQAYLFATPHGTSFVVHLAFFINGHAGAAEAMRMLSQKLRKNLNNDDIISKQFDLSLFLAYGLSEQQVTQIYLLLLENGKLDFVEILKKIPEFKDIIDVFATALLMSDTQPQH